MIVNRERCG